MSLSNIDLLNIDSDKLFEKYTINEIIEIHKKIQVELDRKKNELRVMVGERYRDVITAADAVKCMQSSAEKLYTNIGEMNQKCHQLQNGIDKPDATIAVFDKLKNHNRAIAIQIRILISIPEYIWTCLDNEDFLKAVYLYLFSIHIHTGLELDKEYKTAETFTILSRLKLSINAFRTRILDGIHKNIQMVYLEPQATTRHLCAYILLENKSQEFILSKLIQLREKSLENVLNSDITVHNVVRIQIINLMNCIMCTIMLIHNCFIDFNKQNEGLVQIEIKRILSPSAEKTIDFIDFDSTLLLNYVPSIVRNFKPSCTEGQKTLPKFLIKNTVASWLQSTLKTLQLNLSKSFEFITSVKVLQNIREEAHKLESIENWKEICLETYLPTNFTVWNYFFQSLVSKRVENLICIKIESSLADLYNKLDQSFAVDHTETDLRWFVWKEEGQDLSRDENYHAGLSMKTKGHSNQIVSLCEQIDSKYNELLQDVNIYLHGRDSSDEIRLLETHLQTQVSISIEKLVEYIEEIIQKQTDCSVKIKQSVMSARLLQAISQLCPNLRKCCSYGADQKAWQWDKLHSYLGQKTLKFWNDWLNSMEDSVASVTDHFIQDIQAHNILQILPKWTSIEIEEQTEENIYTSKIEIPSQPSLILLAILYQISKDYNCILPHTLPKIVHTKFTENMADLILNKYEKLSKLDSFNQNLALQFLFDVKFLTTICVRRDSKDLMKKSQQICDQFRAKVDPFDLDVFYPYLQGHIKKSLLQSQALFGCLLAAPAQFAGLGTLDTNKNVEIEPCIIAVSEPTSDIWFPLLPITKPAVKIITPVSVPQVVRREMAPVPAKEDTTTLRSGAAAIFGAMANDWFS